MAIAAVVPVYFGSPEHVELTADTLHGLLDEPGVDRIVVAWHGGTREIERSASEQLATLLAHARVHVASLRAVPFYRLWNVGCERAIAELGRDVKIAVLNNDLRWGRGALEQLALVLDERDDVGVVYPDYANERIELPPIASRVVPTTGTFRRGGMSGFAFMLRGDVWLGGARFDERYCLWYGDDDFEQRARADGWLVARVLGVPIVHLHSRTVNARPELSEHTRLDAELYHRTWGADA